MRESQLKRESTSECVHVLVCVCASVCVLFMYYRQKAEHGSPCGEAVTLGVHFAAGRGATEQGHYLREGRGLHFVNLLTSGGRQLCAESGILYFIHET